MALLDSKQLNPSLTGSFILSGSTQTFIGASDFQGSITASGDISASGTVFADNFQSTGGDSDGISFTDDLNLSGNFTASGDISGSGNIFGTGNLDIDGTSNLEGDVTLQNDLSVTGNITGSNFSGSYVSTGSFGKLSVQGIIQGPVDNHLDIKSDRNIKLHLDNDNDSASQKFTVLDGGGSVRFQVQEDGKTSIGGDVDATSNFVKILSGNVTASGDISGSYTSTGSFGSVQVAGNAGFREYIYHNGDRDTFIRFEPDEINIEAGGENMIFIVEGGGGDQADKVTINNLLADIDFQVKGGTDANLFRTDASNDRVGIGVQSPTEFLHISGSGTTKLFVEGDISGSSTSFGSFGNIFSNTNVTASGNISSSGNLSATGNIDIDGTSNFAGNVTMQNDLVVTGRIDAEEIHTTFISSSITQATGSNIFGDATSDSHQFTGSVDISGSFTLRDGNMTVSDTLTATNIGAFTAAGAIDFSDENMTNVDIDSGNIDAVTFGSTTKSMISGSRDATSISGSLGANAGVIRTLSAVTVSGSRDAASISGSLGANAGVIRTLSAATVSGSFGNQRVGTTDDVQFNHITASGNLSGSATSTGSFGYGFIDKLGVNSKSPIQTLQVAGTVGVANYIYHNNDLNTYLRFEDEKVTLANDDNSIVLEGNVTASGNISGSYTSTGSFGRVVATTLSGDGSNITGLTSAAIDTTAGMTNNYVLTATGATAVTGEANLQFDGTGLAVTGHVTASGNLSGSQSSSGSFGYISVDGIDISSLGTSDISAFSSSIATQLNTLSADVIALSIALG